jgi:hypothetical protein
LCITLQKSNAVIYSAVYLILKAIVLSHTYTVISEKKMDNSSSTCSSFTHMTDECRSARNKISAARELYLKTIRSATKGHINDLGKYTILWIHNGCLMGFVLLIFLVFCVFTIFVTIYLQLFCVLYTLCYLCFCVHSGVLHILCFCFVFLRLVYPMLPVSLNCPFLIGPLGFSNVYLEQF